MLYIQHGCYLAIHIPFLLRFLLVLEALRSICKTTVKYKKTFRELSLKNESIMVVKY